MKIFLLHKSILLGFDKYKYNKSDKFISFNIYFAPLYRRWLSNELKLFLKTNYENLRALEDKEKDKEFKMTCDKKKNHEKDNKFKFYKQNVEIKIFFPKELKYMKNLINFGPENQFNKK